MSVERTFSIIKPDAVAAGQAGAILAMIQKAGFKIVGLRMTLLSEAEARSFYAVHKARPFYSGLVTFMTEILEFQAGNRGLRELSTGSAHGAALASYARTQIAPVVTELLARAHNAGVVRSDVAEQDLALVPIMIGAIIHSARAVDPELWRRTLAIVLDGLRPVHQDRLPGTAPSGSQLARIISGQ